MRTSRENASRATTSSAVTTTTGPPRRPPVVSAARDLLGTARHDLTAASVTTVALERYASAHLAALRTAAAVLAVRTRPAATKRPRNVWSMLPQVAPELTEWAAFFAAGASKRSAAEAGIPRVVSAREADDLLRSAEQFIAVVEVGLGFSYQPRLEGLAS